MGNRRITARLAIVAALCLSGVPTLLADDSGLVVSVDAQHKFTKKFSADVDAEMRTRNNFRTWDRFSVGLGGSYKLNKWLKAGAGYQLIIDNDKEKISYNLDGSFNNWRPSYWGVRHRAYVTLTASYRLGRFDISLRERGQYTYRPEHETTRYDFDNQYWENTTVRSKNKYMLRSRLKVEYDIPASKFTPWASVELFNDLTLEKTRALVGVDYTFRKKHIFELSYRYQHVHGGLDDDGETEMHMLGVGYTFKF